MKVSCICTCHNKPDLTHEAVASILNQSHPDWEALIVDSGVLYDALDGGATRSLRLDSLGKSLAGAAHPGLWRHAPARFPVARGLAVVSPEPAAGQES